MCVKDATMCAKYATMCARDATMSAKDATMSSKDATMGAMSNLSGPVLCCIDAYDSEKRLIFQHFSRSTQLANCISKFYKFC